MSRGVSLHWLCDLIATIQGNLHEARVRAIKEGEHARAHNEAGKWGRHDMPDREIPEVPPNYFLNTHALVSRFIAERTRDLGAPLFALVPPDRRGRPKAFISHTWNSLLVGPQRQRIGTLDALFEEKDEFVWIDFACYNQHKIEHKNISADMLKVVEKIGSLVVAATPTPLYNRSWCLWELYCADTLGLKPNFRVCTGFRNDKVQAVNALYRSFSGVENARSISAEAEEEIRNAFINRYGSVENANTAIKRMLERQLGSSWHELQPPDGPLRFSATPWIADPGGDTLHAYEPYWDPGLMDAVIYGGTETVRDLFLRAGVYLGAQEMSLEPLLKGNPDKVLLVKALKNEDVHSIMGIRGVDINQALPFRTSLSYEVAPPLHFLIPWAELRTLDALLLRGANLYAAWMYPAETRSSNAELRAQLVNKLLNGARDARLASWTPLMLAIHRGDIRICTWLLERKPPPGQHPALRCAFVQYCCPQTGLTALHVAAAMKRTDLVTLLAQSSAPIDASLVNGLTALQVSAIAGDVATIALLLEYGADKDLRDQSGRSALDWARHGAHSSAAELLETTTVNPYERLKRVFSKQRAGLGGTFLEQVLWTLYRDPACTSPFILNRRIAPWETAGPGHLDIEVTFCKQSASIVSTVEVNDRDNGHIVHTRETHYSLRGGAWNAEVVRNWNRQA